MDDLGDLFELGDLLGETSTSEGINLEDTFSEATAQGHKAMDNLRNMIIGLVGIVILALLISLVIKKMNKLKN